MQHFILNNHNNHFVSMNIYVLNIYSTLFAKTPLIFLDFDTLVRGACIGLLLGIKYH